MIMNLVCLWFLNICLFTKSSLHFCSQDGHLRIINRLTACIIKTHFKTKQKEVKPRTQYNKLYIHKNNSLKQSGKKGLLREHQTKQKSLHPLADDVNKREQKNISVMRVWMSWLRSPPLRLPPAQSHKIWTPEAGPWMTAEALQVCGSQAMMKLALWIVPRKRLRTSIDSPRLEWYVSYNLFQSTF